jgi:cytosine/adenosine deaminase-related metal-dependent hydrolase
LDAKIGSLAKGKQADLVLWDGDPLEPLTQVKQVFIRGLPVSIRSFGRAIRQIPSVIRISLAWQRRQGVGTGKMPQGMIKEKQDTQNVWP